MSRPLVIFDLGNVLVHVDFLQTLNEWSRLSGFSHDEILKRFDMNGQIHLDFERGDVSPDRFRSALSEALGINITRHQFEQSWNSMISEVYPGIIEIIDQLKAKGTKLAVLSNTNRVHEEYFMKKYAKLLSLFEGIFLSHKLRYRKPETAVFEAVLKKFRAQASETFFFDDKTENIAGARKAGIHSQQVKSVEEIKKALTEWNLM